MHFTAREQAELERSAREARNLSEVTAVDRAAVARYENPPANTNFPLEYAFHLLGNIAGLMVLDYGCGFGENLVHLALRGAKVIGLDISPELIALARKRADAYKVKADFVVGSAYATGLPSASVDVVFAIAIFHHLDLAAAKEELGRVLKPSGKIILQEPVRDSKLWERVRTLAPEIGEISRYESPLKRAQLDWLCEGFVCDAVRRFRLPFVAVPERFFPRFARSAYALDAWLLQTFPALSHFGTIEVRRLKRP